MFIANQCMTILAMPQPAIGDCWVKHAIRCCSCVPFHHACHVAVIRAVSVSVKVAYDLELGKTSYDCTVPSAMQLLAVYF